MQFRQHGRRSEPRDWSQTRIESSHLRSIKLRGVLDDSLPDFPAQIQPGKFRVALLKLLDDAQTLGVVFETAEFGHQSIQNTFTRMAERRMAQIVGQHDRLGKVFIEPQRTGDGSTDLRALHRMGQPGAIIITFMIDEDLGLIFQPTECCRMHDAIPIPLKDRTQGMLGLGMGAPARID